MAEIHVPSVVRRLLEVAALRLKTTLLAREVTELRARLDRLGSPRAV